MKANPMRDGVLTENSAGICRHLLLLQLIGHSGTADTGLSEELKMENHA